jgi:hypothetical protein
MKRTLYSVIVPSSAPCIRKLWSSSALLVLTLLAILSTSGIAGAQTYCVPPYTSGCTSGDFIQGFSTTGGSTNITNNGTGCTGTNGQYYSTMGHTGVQGTTVNFSITNCPSWSQGQKIWVDWNQDGTFNSTNELVHNGAATVPGGAITAGNFTIPITATTGTTRMRVRCVFANTVFDACSSQSFGEYEDYNFTVVAAVPCSGTPNAGTAVATPAAPCPGASVVLNAQGASLNTGLSYQWQEFDAVTSTWINAIGGTGATTPTYNTPGITGTIQYRLQLTCTNAGGGVANSVPVSLSAPVPAPPYVQTFESITANNTLPPCMAATNLGTLVQTYTTNQASSNRINHTPGGSKFASFRWNSNNDWLFTPGLALTGGVTYRFSYWYITDGINGWTNLRAAYGTTQTPAGMTNIVGTINSPVNTTYQQAVYTFTPASTGTYFLGIGCNAAVAPNFLSFDDIEVVAMPPCSGAPVVTTSPADSLITCPNGAFTLTSPLAATSGLSYQWDSSLNGTTWGPIAGATTNDYASAAVGAGAIVYYRLNITCTNSGITTVGNPIKVVPSSPAFASVPYFNGFETWNNFCATSDVPSGGNWYQPNNSMGNASWRRNDQGATAAWTSPTLGTYSPVSQSGSFSARFHTYTTGGFTPPFGFDEGQLDMYLDCSATTGAKGLYFYQINTLSNKGDSLTIWYSTNNGLTFAQLAGWDTAATWRRRIVNIPSNSATTIVRFAARKWTASDFSDIGIDSVYVAAPCTGTPVAGSISPSGTLTPCAGSTVSFNLTGASMAGNINVLWEWSTTGAAGPFTAAPGANTGYQYTTPAISGPVWVRARVTCGGSGSFAVTNVVTISVSAVTPAALPFTEDFESWSTRCNTSDIPSTPWTNAPSTGNMSWRREDQGSTANWTSLTNGAWYPLSPVAANGSHAARFHTYPGPVGGIGRMDLYVNCSGAGNKELQYYVNMHNNSQFNNDSLRVQYSTNGGLSFTQLTSVQTTNDWKLFTHVLPSTSANTVIRFEGLASSFINDIGLDYVRVLPPCAGKPVAGTIVPVSPCSGQNFTLKTQNTSASAGLTYQWQYCNSTAATAPAAGSGCWTNLTGGATMQATDNISQSRWYRVIVTCPSSAQADTTAAYFVQVAPFYLCYCQSAATSNTFEDIGNVTIRTQPANTVLLNNGVGTPLASNPAAVNLYTSFTNLPPVPMYRDSSYRMSVQQISQSSNFASRVAVYIDYNQDGQFDPVTERVVNAPTSASTVPNWNASGTFTIPPTATAGITGMRVVLAEGSTVPTPCASYTWGETEDYLVEIRLAPCNGPANAGLAVVSDTAICSGYPVQLLDTTYQRNRYGLVRQWQASTNNGASWSNIGPQNRDTLTTVVTGATWYRLRMRCTITGDSSFSNIVTVSLNQPYQCYCVSYADGGINGDADSTDIGSFKISSAGGTQSYLFTTGGPHLINPVATRGRTDYTGTTPPIELWADSTYDLEIYHILRAMNHKDARVTLFMDFDNDLKYESAPGPGLQSERVYSGYSGINSWFMTGQVTIPSQQIITNVPTGMRLIINENVGPNIPSDEACGRYISGETEDYVVTFRKVGGTQGVSGIGSLRSLSLYPNPTTGSATVAYSASKPVKELQITVTNMTGQVVLRQDFTAPGREFQTTLDLSDRPRGFYFIELRADGEKLVRKLVVQ